MYVHIYPTMMQGIYLASRPHTSAGAKKDEVGGAWKQGKYRNRMETGISQLYIEWRLGARSELIYNYMLHARSLPDHTHLLRLLQSLPTGVE